LLGRIVMNSARYIMKKLKHKEAIDEAILAGMN
jgi:hypothetical protein